MWERLLDSVKEPGVRSFLDKARQRQSLAGLGTQQEASLKFLYVPPIPTACVPDGLVRQQLVLAELVPVVFRVQGQVLENA